MKFCEHCGSELKDNSQFCANCGAEIKKTAGEKEQVQATVVSSNPSNTTEKDNTVAGFVCAIIGALCCTYVAIPGLILSIQSLQKMNAGKIDSKRKWMAIVGIVLSVIGLIQMIYNFTHLDEQSARIQETIDQFQNAFNK